MLKKNWLPLGALAGAAVLLTTGAVAWVGVAMLGLPVAVAVTLGAIVAPPDAAAATALLSRYDLPQRTSVILRGESLLNDAVSLLIYTTSVAVAAKGFTVEGYLPEAAMAVPGGILLGFLIGRAFLFVRSRLSGTLGGTLLEFVTTFGTWVLAERFNLSAILAVVALAMTIAHHMPSIQNARHRIASYSVWEGMVFFLNVLAFLLMGLQARHIVLDLWSENLGMALFFQGRSLRQSYSCGSHGCSPMDQSQRFCTEDGYRTKGRRPYRRTWSPDGAELEGSSQWRLRWRSRLIFRRAILSSYARSPLFLALLLCRD